MATSAASTASAPHDASSLPKVVRAALVGAPLMGALLVWALSLPSIDLYSLDDYGLTRQLPVGWYAALAVCVVGAALHACVGSTRWAWAYLLGAVVVLFATLPLLAEQPHYSWVYKHLGVVRFLEQNHQVDTSIDIYNRWPGFFAFSAVFGSAGGQLNPVKYAAWSEFVFTTFNLLILAGIVRAVTGSRRIPVAAALLFVALNWVGQMYYSPQAMTFFCHLVIVWLVVTQLSRDAPGRGGRAVLRLAARIVRRPQDPALPAGHRWMPAWVAVLAVIAIHAAVVASHQLTPYLVVLEVGGLTLLGLVRPRLLVLGLLALALAYLAPNLDFVKDRFGIFSSPDPFSNIARPSSFEINPMAGKVWSARAGQALAVVMLGGTAISTLVLARRGVGTRALVLLVLALAPFALVLGQNYGGEVVLRVVLFSSPWCAALIAWALMDVSRSRWRLPLLGGGAVLASALFVPASFGQEELHSFRPDELRASEHLYAEGRTPAVVMATTPLGFLPNYGPRYPEFEYANLLRGNRFRNRSLGAADVPAVAATMEGRAPRGYLVFSTAQNTYARVSRITPPGALRSLEAAVARSARFRAWYRGSDARIYELLPRHEVTTRARRHEVTTRARSAKRSAAPVTRQPAPPRGTSIRPSPLLPAPSPLLSPPPPPSPPRLRPRAPFYDPG